MTLSRLDLLRLQHAAFLAPGAVIDVPDGRFDDLERLLDEIALVLRQAGPGQRYVIHELRSTGADLWLVADAGTLPERLLERVELAKLDFILGSGT